MAAGSFGMGSTIVATRGGGGGGGGIMTAGFRGANAALIQLKTSVPLADREGMQRSRDEVRMLCADMVEVCWKDSAGSKHKAAALLEDISRSGMCLQFE